MADKFKRALDYWHATGETAELFRQGHTSKPWSVEGKMVLTEKYETKNGTVMFEAEGTDLEFVAVSREKMLWYLGLVEEFDQMGINPYRVESVKPDKL